MVAVSRRLSGWLLLAIALLGLAAASAVAQTYPSQPIRFIVGFSPGSATDPCPISLDAVRNTDSLILPAPAG